MPGPTTEVLSDDLKEVRTDLHRVEVTLAAEIHKVGKAVAKLGAEFADFKWLLDATLATTLSGIVGSAYSTGQGPLASRVNALEGRFDKSEGRLERIELCMTRAVCRADGIGEMPLQSVEQSRSDRGHCLDW